MSEIDLVRQLQLEASSRGHRLWRNNSGVGWVGPQVRVTHPMMVMMYPGDVLLRKARALHAGLAPGSSDLIGLTSSGQFLAVEVKMPKKQATTGQKSFLETIQDLGGHGILARTIDDFKI